MKLEHYMLKHHIHVALTQETKLQHQHRTSTIPNYSVTRQDRQHGKGGGLITYIHHNINNIDTSQITHNLLRIDHHTEPQSFKIETGMNKHITIINAYIPPDTSPTLPAGCGIQTQPSSPEQTQKHHSLQQLRGKTLQLVHTTKQHSRYTQIKKIYSTELHNNTKRWLANYLSGRQAYVHYSGKSSKTLNIPNRVRQGSVLSPTLFNLYKHDIPQPPENICRASYADDITITSTHGKISTCSTQVQNYMDTITTWMNTNRLKTAPTKSTTTLLTSHNAEHKQTHHHSTKHNNTTHTIKILGVTSNTSRSFSQHIDKVSEKCNKKLKTLCTLTGTNFGYDKETLILLYKQYIRSVISYASPALAPIASKAKLRTSNNRKQSSKDHHRLHKYHTYSTRACRNTSTHHPTTPRYERNTIPSLCHQQPIQCLSLHVVSHTEQSQ
ncbi:Reverse transcriptase domain [Trinorchestia longiramus]|nr:Reverse transcriptase domain [Trinorchestia longiramus]